MVKGLCRKFNALLRKEAIHENEPQRILFLLRIILLILGLYFLIIPFVFCIVGPKTEVWTGYIFAAMSVAAFYATYRLKVHTSVLVCSGTAAGMDNCVCDSLWMGLRYSASDV
ncbi:MAG: hypothetical protein ACLURP_15195 [Ruminococcus sp.]